MLDEDFAFWLLIAIIIMSMWASGCGCQPGLCEPLVVDQPQEWVQPDPAPERPVIMQACTDELEGTTEVHLCMGGRWHKLPDEIETTEFEPVDEGR